MAGLILLAFAIRLGSFDASDLLIAWFDEAGEGGVLLSEQVPAQAALLQIGVELALAADVDTAPSAHASFVITAEGRDEPISQGEGVLEAHEDHFRAGVQFPLAKLPPGAYDVTMTLVEDGRPVGSLVRRIRIAGR